MASVRLSGVSAPPVPSHECPHEMLEELIPYQGHMGSVSRA